MLLPKITLRVRNYLLGQVRQHEAGHELGKSPEIQHWGIPPPLCRIAYRKGTGKITLAALTYGLD
jgi:hypothetical protein